jgi:hypothetical protein
MAGDPALPQSEEHVGARHEEETVEIVGWVFLGFVALLVLVTLIWFLTWIPEIRRYTKVRKM